MQKNKTKQYGAVLAISVAAATSSLALAQSSEEKSFEAVVITSSPHSLTHNAIDSAKENVKTIPGGASIVDLNHVREGRQSTWSDSLGMAPGVFIQDRFGSEEARISIRGDRKSVV